MRSEEFARLLAEYVDRPESTLEGAMELAHAHGFDLEIHITPKEDDHEDPAEKLPGSR